MTDYVSLSLQIIASGVTLWAIWQMGNKSLLGPSLSIVSDFTFFTLDLYLHLWGLIPFCVVLLALHIRNLIKWRNDTSAIQGNHGERQASTANQDQPHHLVRRRKEAAPRASGLHEGAEKATADTKNKGTQI